MTARASACSATPAATSRRRLCGDGRRAADPGSVGAVRARDLGHRRARPRRRAGAPTIRPRTSIATASCTPRPCRPRSRRARPPGARAAAFAILEALDYVGVIGVEFFVLRRRLADRQRDRAARAQFRPLDGGRLRRLAVRAAHPRRRRPAARRADAAFRLRDGEPDRRRRLTRAGTAGRAGSGAASLRQGRSPARPQDGPFHAAEAARSEPVASLRSRPAAVDTGTPPRL